MNENNPTTENENQVTPAIETAETVEPNANDNQQQQSPPQNNQQPATSFSYAHELLIAQRNVDRTTLPKEIKKELQGWDMLRKKAEKNPAGNLTVTVKKKSVVIADMILDYMEKELPAEEPQKNDEQIKTIVDEFAKTLSDKTIDELISLKEVLVTQESSITRDDDKKINAGKCSVVDTQIELLKKKIEEQKENEEDEQDEQNTDDEDDENDNQLTKEQLQERAVLRELRIGKGKIHFKKLCEILELKTTPFVIELNSLTLYNIPFTNYYERKM